MYPWLYVLCGSFDTLCCPHKKHAKINDEINILEALTGVLKTLKETDKLASKHLDQWSMYAATVSKCTTDEDGSTVYQMQELKDFSEAQGYFSSKYEEYCHKNSQCVKSRLSWSDMQLMRDIVFMLSLHDWEKLVQKENDLAAIDRLVEQFSTPLQGAEADVHVIKMEFGSMIEYAVFHAPNSSNALTLVKLLLSLPASNEKLERTIYWVQHR